MNQQERKAGVQRGRGGPSAVISLGNNLFFGGGGITQWKEGLQ